MSDLNSKLALHQHYTHHCNVPNRTVFCRDNLEILQAIHSECIDLMYLDPPFNKKKIFTAPIGSSAEGASFKDIFTQADVKNEWIETIKEDHYSIYRLLEAVRDIEGRTSYNFCYLAYMAIRLIECHRVLKDTGSMYLHCDPTMSHYLKLLLDCIFGEKQFRNEIVWCYTGPSGSKKNFPAKSDTILRYSKSEEWIFNEAAIRIPYKKLTHQHRTEKNTGIGGKLTPELVAEYKKKGKVPTNWWDDISPVGRIKTERTGYPTQKPLALLERIINASSNKGDLILDPFCGCATTCVAAEKLERHWIGIDISIQAYELVQKRIKAEVYDKGLLSGADGYLPTINFSTVPPKRTDSEQDTQDKKYVYIISNPKYKNLYKVGIARNWESRLNSYQTSDPHRKYKMEYKIQVSNYRELEAYIHRKFGSIYEWVREDLQTLIAEMEKHANIPIIEAVV